VHLTRLREYKGRTAAIDEVLAYAEKVGVRRQVRSAIGQVCEELLMNALYDAPVDEQGHPLFAEVEVKARLEKLSPRPVSIRYAATETGFAVSVRDRFGRLDKATVLRYIDKCLHSPQQIDRKVYGAGLGIYLIANAATQFGCAADLGIDGPSDEMPLAAMRAALEDRMADGTNAGWRRDDALLAVVFLTDENDCSYEASVTLPFPGILCESQQEPVGNYVTFLDQYAGAREKWASATIAGPGPDRCSSGFGDADYCERLDQFTQQTGENAVFSSICEGDLTIGLGDALELFDAACDSFPSPD